MAPLGGGLILSCDFDGVPIPTVEWLRNANLLLSSDSDPHISITTDSDSSLLELTNLQRDSGGQYFCRATNVVGVSSSMAMITVMGNLCALACVHATNFDLYFKIFSAVPPSPPTNVRVVIVDEFVVTLAWSNGFDGFSAITGVQIEIFEGHQLVDTRDLNGSSALETNVIRALTPFTDYTFVLRVRNAIGLSDPVNVNGSTLSLGEESMIYYIHQECIMRKKRKGKEWTRPLI